MDQYSKSIGKLESSHVIRKFLDSHKIRNLTAYLEELHKKRLANDDHTTLLLNCYTKLKDKEKLNRFMRESAKRKDEPNFDVEMAIKVLRQSGFYEEALYLASEHQIHDFYLKIQLEDKCDSAKEAINYIKHQLPTNKLRARYLRKYGRYMMSLEPNETTELVKTVCSAMSDDNSTSNCALEDTERSRALSDILNSVSFLDLHEPLPEPTHPTDFLDVFIKNPVKMMEFLEYIVEEKPDKADKAIYNSLLDLYLITLSKESEPKNEENLKKKILQLLKDPGAKYNIEQAMISCQMNHFTEGMLFLYQQSKLYDLILVHFIEQNDFEKIIQTCEQYGDENERLWVKAFWHFTTVQEAETSQLLRVLEEVDKRKLIPPINVVKILSDNSPSAPLSVIKDYLVRSLTKESEIVTENEKLIHQYRDNTEKMREEIVSIRTQPKTFQSSRCSQCNMYLELPSIHFLCGHSYHHGCFESSESDKDCPLCLPEHHKLLNLIDSQKDQDVASLVGYK